MQWNSDFMNIIGKFCYNWKIIEILCEGVGGCTKCIVSIVLALMPIYLKYRIIRNERIIQGQRVRVPHKIG